MDGYQQFEHTKIAFLAQLSSLSQHLKSAADVAEQYHSLVAQMPYTPGGNFVAHDGAVAVAPTPRKRKNGADETDGRRKKKKERDPDMPKRAASAYLFYQNEVRQQLKAVHPHTPHHELLGMIAQQWQNMTPAERKPYEDRQKDAKHKYEVEIAVYNRNHGIEPKAPAVKKGKSKSPLTPIVPAIVPVAVQAVPSLSSEDSEEGSEVESDGEDAQAEDAIAEEEDEEEEEEEPAPPAKKPKSKTSAPPSPPVKGRKERKTKA